MGNDRKRTVAHCKIDAQTKRLLVLYFNVEDIFLNQSNLTFCEFDRDFVLKQKKEFLVPAQMMVHDWGFTEDHYILIVNSVKLDLPGSLKALCGQAPMVSAVSTNPSQPTTPVYLLPRFSDTSGVNRDWRIPVEAPSQLWISHIGNAFEERDHSGNARIQIQAAVSSYQWWCLEKMFGYDFQSPEFDPSVMNVVDPEKTGPHLVQVSIDLDAEGSCLGCSVANCSTQWHTFADFPVINPAHSGRQNRFLYASSTSGSRKFLPFFPPDTIAKLDLCNHSVKTWMPGKRSFVGEPLFVSRGTSEEEDGYVLVVEYAVFKQRCYLVVLDAKRIGEDDAVVAKLQVPKHLRFPSAFHGFWDAQ
ncbi:hypothetical protein HPP92_014054 [Vanilla planifolia]|uniref:Uncharacterized protein n=1 Tax=Vanilla planifolia TaxID=51239 RepID=A0A835UUF0_VANPL|nr:hypothetical protein HPP92_014054 [Vanilla planifolia]